MPDYRAALARVQGVRGLGTSPGATRRPAITRTRFARAPVVISLALGAGLLAGCGGANYAPATTVASLPGGQPGKSKPAVTLGTKNFTEEFILGQLYAQALQAKGFTVHLRENIGPTEVVDPALIGGQIDLYPEYTGVIVSTLAHITLAAPGTEGSAPTPPQSAKQAYEQAAQFEDRRGFRLLKPTPFQDADRVATLPAFAAAHGLHTMSDLKKLGSFTYGGPPENQTRYEGIVGMREAYGLNNAVFVPYPVGDQYQPLDQHRVETIAIFTTDGKLLAHHYTILSDPKNIFGYQNVAPVVNKGVLHREGPAFAQTLNAVSSRLTTTAMQRMNAEVVLDHRPPAAVASQFLASQHLT
jgi:osmoprotectant transport system substrate-binding protein